jgi:hypothetical protein
MTQVAKLANKKFTISSPEIKNIIRWTDSWSSCLLVCFSKILFTFSFGGKHYNNSKDDIKSTTLVSQKSMSDYYEPTCRIQQVFLEPIVYRQEEANDQRTHQT